MFGTLTLVVKVAQIFGHLLGLALVEHLGIGLHGISTVAACFLAIVSLLGVVLAVLSVQTVRRSSADGGFSSSETAPMEGTRGMENADVPEVYTMCLAHGLSEREAEIVSLYCHGRSASAIGEQISLAESTVRTYIRRAYDKLGVHSKQELFDLVSAE